MSALRERQRWTAPRHAGQALATILAYGTLQLHAGNLQVAPILLEFGEGQQAQALWLENNGTRPLHAQVRVRQWTQDGSADVLEPSDTLQASPAIAEIAAGQRQLVRILRPTGNSAPPPHEQAFRLLVDELPEPQEQVTQGLQFLLRYSIPVFILPAGIRPKIERAGPATATDATQLHGEWHQTAGTLSVTLHNTGQQRIRLSQLRGLHDGATIELTPGLLGYVLPGQQMQWTLQVPPATPAINALQARFNDDPAPQLLPVTGR